MATLIDELKSQVVEPLVKRMDATDKKLSEIEKKASTPQFLHHRQLAWPPAGEMSCASA